METNKTFRVGTRKSQLAMIQTNWVIDELKKIHKDVTYEIIGISTTGDKILDVALSKIGEKSLFTKELETALINNEIDFVVHSLKDLPTILPDGLTIASICKREDPRDAVLFNPKFSGFDLEMLPEGSKIGTSSLRRVAQLKNKFPHLEFIDVRGNLNTRLKKLDDQEGPYSALILAAAGIKRMGWENRIGQFLEPDQCMHAVGQGAVGVECSLNNEKVLELLKPLNDADTYFRCMAERNLLRKLEGGCSVPVAVTSSVHQNILSLNGSVWSLDGSESVSLEGSCNLSHETVVSNNNTNEEISLTSVYSREFLNYNCKAALLAAQLGINVAEKLLEQGAAEILEKVKAGLQ